MSNLIGILVDVSFSMKNSIGDGVEEKGGSWARSIFKVMNELIKHDVSSSNKTFALAFGGSSHPEVFDLLSTIDKVREEQSSIEDLRSSRSKISMITEALETLERNGAPRVRTWAKMDVLLRVIDDTSAAEILYFLNKSHEFTKAFVDDCIPKQCCRVSVDEYVVPLIALFANLALSIGIASRIKDSVCKAIEKGTGLVVKTMKTVKTVSVTKKAIRSVHDASKILLDSIEQFLILNLRSRESKRELIEKTLTFLEENGAEKVRTWGRMDVLLEVIDHTTAAGILHHLKRSSQFTERFVKECLPRQCREYPESFTEAFTEAGFILANSVSEACPSVRTATEESVREVVRNGKQLIATGYNDRELTDKEFDELLKAMEPHIYWKTPLMQAMRHSVDLFSYPEFENHRKLLFILSDGQPTDGESPPVQELSDLEVTTVSCFITDQNLPDPRHLYSILDESWEEPAKFMFRTSSTITTQKIPRTLFVKRGWKIDIDNNETRLFFQVNHPEIIKDVCDLAKEAVLSQDALSDILSSIHLDIYITRKNQGFGVKKQPDDEATCYAYASAAVLHLAMKRIVGRDGGYPDFDKLRDKLIDKYGIYGARTIKVLKEICPAYRLQCKDVDANGAMKAISKKRPVVARFSLTGAQWDQFYRFYEENPKGILTRSFLNSGSHRTSTPPHGHAVVLTSYDSESLRLMNSEGVGFADFGFFRVQNAGVLGLEFVDVFWKLDNLSEQEKRAYEQHGAEIAAKLIKSLKGIQVAQYKCPLQSCAVESKVVDYSGHLLEAKCPKCGGTFNANEAGGDLALNLYLTSLTY